MPKSPVSLDQLRAEIDAIDGQIHDLIRQRAEVVERIKAAKGEGATALRPGREAQMLRDRLAAHDGPLPFLVIGRIWREIISAMTLLQGPLSIAVMAPENRRGYWDLARDHFGGVARLQAMDSPLAVLRAVADRAATVGIVPVPEDADDDPWWTRLIDGEDHSPKVIARLPFIGRGNARSEDRPALVLAAMAPAATGHDRSYLAFDLATDLSRGGFKTLLEGAGLTPTAYCARVDGSGDAARHLIEVEGFVAADDERLEPLRAAAGDRLIRLHCVGSYAVPLEPKA